MPRAKLSNATGKTYYLDEPTTQALRAAAQARNCSISLVIRELVRNHLLINSTHDQAHTNTPQQTQPMHAEQNTV